MAPIALCWFGSYMYDPGLLPTVFPEVHPPNESVNCRQHRSRV